ncbi:hypothetical protein [Riemerella columbina]|uniref:hypothetical protein n=1 Tax=Riemerella columbina TaxID=103810 RepID=UPI001FDF4E60|nr:hypothetical protein [Riemerella columbina]
MMKLRSLLVLMIFLNFLALPSIAKLADWDIPTMNLTVSEEETHSAPTLFSEKTLPKTLDIRDFLKLLELKLNKQPIIVFVLQFHKSPVLNIISPPPEFIS